MKKTFDVMKRTVIMLLVMALVFALMPYINMGKAYAASTSNETTIYNYITKTKKMNMAAACGMLANLNSESGLRPNNVENTAEPQLICEKTGKQYTDATYTADVNAKKISKKEFAETQIKRSDGSFTGFGYGLCQWTSKNRKMDLYDYAQQYAEDNNEAFDIADLEMQLGFLFEELSKSYKQTYYTLKNAPNSEVGAYMSAYVMCTNFEIPANTELNAYTRAKYALTEYWDEYSGLSANESKYSYLGICGYTYPAKVSPGKGITCRGYIVANKKIKTISAKILDANGKTKYSFIEEKTASNASYYRNLGAAVDDKMLFSKLTAGTYTYVVSATDFNGKTVKFEKSFKVSSTYTSSTANYSTTCYNPSKQKVTDYKYPSVIKKGSSYANVGKVTSNFMLRQVSINILDEDGNSVAFAKATPNEYTYDISNLDSTLDMSKLKGGKYIYRLYAKDRMKSSYLLKEEFYVDSKAIASQVAPEKIAVGNDFSVKGTVSSDMPLDSVYVRVVDSNEKVVTGKTVYPNAKTYNIDKINSYLDFSKCPVGSFKYRVTATDQSGSKKLLDKAFTVYKPETLTIGDYKYPTTIRKGSQYKNQGTIVSNNKILQVSIRVYDANEKSYAFATVKPETTTFDISYFDDKIDLSKLAGGKYTYRLYVKNEDQSKYLIKKAFYVDSKKITNVTAPSSIAKGKDFTVKGTISSDMALSYIYIRVVNSNNKVVTSKKLYPNAKSYNVYNVNKYLDFSKCLKGKHQYRITATDKSGERRLLTREFSVYTPSTMKASGYSYPTKIKVGKGFSIYGTVKSNYNLKKVKISIINSKGKAVLSATADLTGKKKNSYYLSNLDSKIAFGKLSVGKYQYKVYGYDTVASKTLVNKAFTVYKP